MKIECSKTKLHDAISKADKITGKNATLPVLSCLVLEAKESNLIIRSTNLDLGIEMTIPVKVHQEGIVAVPSSLFVSYISNIPGEDMVNLESVRGTLLITGNKNETQIKTLSSEDFPNIPKLESEKKFRIRSEDLVLGLKSVFYSASVSSMKPELSSVYLYPDESNVVFVATDSFRLAEKKIKVEKADTFEPVLIPFKNVTEIIRVMDSLSDDVEVRFDNDQIAFVIGGIYMISRIIDGNFPDYKQIIPKTNSSEVIVLKQDLIQSLKLSNIFSDNFNQISVKISPEDNIFEIRSKNVDKGENRNTVSATLRGEGLEINFNHKYIVDAFPSISSESITLYFSGLGKPMVIRGVGDNSFMYLVMPMNK